MANPYQEYIDYEAGWNSATEFYATMGLELGLRWLHDRTWDYKVFSSTETRTMLRARIACLELGLRWLHDRALERDECLHRQLVKDVQALLPRLGAKFGKL
jgi:hypothetical protein